MRIVFVALGSRGDVQPLAVIAGRIAALDGGVQVALSSHAELSLVCRRLAPQAAFRPLAAPCFLGDSQDLENPVCVVDARGRRRKEWIQVIGAARDADLLVCNLFAMPPCIHLAEKLAVQLVVCSPSLVPYRLPESFESAFERELPDVHEAVRSGRTGVSWQDITDWLWPIFTEAHGQFREHFLQLPTIPDLEQLIPPKLFFGVEGMLLEQARLCREIEWSLPTSSSLFGPWYAEAEPPQDSSTAWPFAPGDRPVFVTFGSMGQHDLLEDPDRLLASLRQALRACGKVGAVQWPKWKESDGQDGVLRRVPSDLSFGWAFGFCCCCIHHGGIGTVSECLKAGIPQAWSPDAQSQVVMPIAYDQPFWAAVVDRTGVGTRARDPSDLEESLQRALSTPVGEKAAAHKSTGEQAVSQVCAALLELLTQVPSTPNAWRDDKSLSLRQPCPVALPDIHGFASPSSSEAAWVHSEIFQQRVYTPPGIRTWPGMNVVDVGGGAGLFTIFARKICRANLITLVEPAHESFNLCVRNVTAALGNVDRISFHECACGADQGESELLYFPGLPSNSCLGEFESLKRRHIADEGGFNPDLVDYLTAAESRETVVRRRLSSLLPRAGGGTEGAPAGALDVSLLKIDAEGSEARVLEGIGDGDWGAIHQVAVEVHSDGLLEECLRVLRPRYARVWHEQQRIPHHHMLFATRGPTATPPAW